MRSNGIACRHRLKKKKNQKTREMQEAWALVEEISKITGKDEAFDVDVRWARAPTDGGQTLEQITASTQRR